MSKLQTVFLFASVLLSLSCSHSTRGGNITLVTDDAKRSVISALTFVDPHNLAIGFSDGRVQLWDLDALKLKVSFERHDSSSVLQISSADDQDEFLSTRTDGKLNIWHVNQERPIATMPGTWRPYA